MTKQELYLKTIFCCMSCDGDIAAEEIDVVKKMIVETSLFKGLDSENLLNNYILEINKEGSSFLKRYLSELSNIELSMEEELSIVDLAIATIEADSRIEYTEVKFFKKIRTRLSISDEQILAKHPDKEDFLLPDISVAEDPAWENVRFDNVSLS